MRPENGNQPNINRISTPHQILYVFNLRFFASRQSSLFLLSLKFLQFLIHSAAAAFSSFFISQHPQPTNTTRSCRRSMADEDQRKTASRELHDHLDEERTTVMLAMFETDESDEDDEGDEDMSDFSDEDYQASSRQSGIEGEEVEYPDYDDYSNYEEIEEDDIDPDLLSYEELIALGELVGVESRGLSEVEISKSLHPSTFQSRTSKTLIDRCVVCQLEYDEGENLVALPCNHQYHSQCITTWLQIKKVCPICNDEVSPAKTPKIS